MTLANNQFRLDLKHFKMWSPTASQARRAFLDHLVVWSPMVENFVDLSPYAKQFIVSEATIERIEAKTHAAIMAGRLIDFGHLSNTVLKHGGNRGGPLWQRGAIHSPFHEPWVFMHTWDDSSYAASAVYLVNPTSDTAIEVCELQPVLFGSKGAFMIGDQAMFDRSRPVPPGNATYHAIVAPNIARFDPEVGSRINNGGSPEGAAVGNVGDPAMTAMLILATRNVERTTVRADDKLQRSRVKHGKPAIPNYDVVNSAPYVTAIQARGSRREQTQTALGGHHRSPVPHIRMGHPREYASGRSIFIADTLVNVPPELRQGFKGQRSHYRV